ncbi:hypothetical protein FBY03_14111 [Pseudomonas sp. SJZ079]|uniref:hypothetical protein n=1 Tax=Pseudomonas sp. SJZ079 TaxID=2572887 RepID=UPI00119BE321|nr:hypothetical protein [Pseudomonas sp. SJZ079]TWC28029.1 hypothetical protein FBY03_14111 [Pseudomonas sp. SJZ079]
MKDRTVPESYIGVWQRTLLQTAAGDDTDTRVFWLQSRRLHVDLRIPLDRPVFPAGLGLHEVSREQALALAQQGGFAGSTQVDGELCRWQREIDYRPPALTADVGVMRFAAADTLLEDCQHGRYHERWQRLPDSLGGSQGFRLEQVGPPGAAPRIAYLLVCGAYFAFVRSREVALPAGANLQSLVEAAQQPQERVALLDCEVSFGQRDGQAASWQIELSTLPLREGTTLFAEPPVLLGGAPRWQCKDRLWITSPNGPLQWQISDVD